MTLFTALFDSIGDDSISQGFRERWKHWKTGPDSFCNTTLPKWYSFPQNNILHCCITCK